MESLQKQITDTNTRLDGIEKRVIALEDGGKVVEVHTAGMGDTVSLRPDLETFINGDEQMFANNLQYQVAIGTAKRPDVVKSILTQSATDYLNLHPDAGNVDDISPLVDMAVVDYTTKFTAAIAEQQKGYPDWKNPYA